MRCPKQSPAEEVQQAQQQLGPGTFWPPYPRAPQPVFHPWVTSPYHIAGPTPPYAPFPPQIAGEGERSSWFRDLVAAVSKEIKDDDKKTIAEDSRKTNAAAPAGLSVEDEKALVDALNMQKAGRLTMEQVFRELIQKHGRTESEWKTFFFANYERLISQLDLHYLVERASADSPSSTDEESEPESESESERESEMDWEELSSSGKSDSSPPRAKAKCTTKTPLVGTTNPSLRAKPCAITDADLRAMAQYRCEHGDGDGEPGRYSTTRWREFAYRPENRKRTLAAWACIPRNHKHADAIDRYVREYWLRGDVAESKPVLPIPAQEPKNTLTTMSYLGAVVQAQVPDIRAEATEDLQMGMETEDGRAGLSSEGTVRAGRGGDVGQMEIIDLTDEKEVE